MIFVVSHGPFWYAQIPPLPSIFLTRFFRALGEGDAPLGPFVVHWGEGGGFLGDTILVFAGE